jgi:hypothetical protein
MFTSLPFDAAFCESVSANATEAAIAPLLLLRDAISPVLGTMTPSPDEKFNLVLGEPCWEGGIDEH